MARASGSGADKTAVPALMASVASLNKLAQKEQVSARLARLTRCQLADEEQAERLFGQVVQYDHEVLLQHVKSKAYAVVSHQVCCVSA